MVDRNTLSACNDILLFTCRKISILSHTYFIIIFYTFIYLFVCLFIFGCVGSLLLHTASGGYSVAVCGFLITVASLVAEHGLQARGLQ